MSRIAIAFALFFAACDSGNKVNSGNLVQDACINVCACYSSASQINSCRTDCNKMGRSARLKVGRAYSGGSASFTPGIFWSSGSGGRTHVASDDCLNCLAGATCAQLEGGTACLNKCQSLEPVGSGSH